MGPDGIYFLEKTPGLEAYMINKQGMATFTSGFKKYVLSSDQTIHNDAGEEASQKIFE